MLLMMRLTMRNVRGLRARIASLEAGILTLLMMSRDGAHPYEASVAPPTPRGGAPRRCSLLMCIERATS